MSPVGQGMCPLVPVDEFRPVKGRRSRLTNVEYLGDTAQRRARICRESCQVRPLLAGPAGVNRPLDFRAIPRHKNPATHPTNPGWQTYPRGGCSQPADGPRQLNPPAGWRHAPAHPGGVGRLGSVGGGHAVDDAVGGFHHVVGGFGEHGGAALAPPCDIGDCRGGGV